MLQSQKCMQITYILNPSTEITPLYTALSNLLVWIFSQMLKDAQQHYIK